MTAHIVVGWERRKLGQKAASFLEPKLGAFWLWRSPASRVMDEAWERAVEAARAGEDPSSVRSLTLDGAVKCSQGRLPAASLLEQFSQLRLLSIANVGLASLAEFPSLRYLERLILSDNRIAGGLDHLVQAGLSSLRDLDLSNNKIQLLEDLAPLAELNLLSLDLYECPVTRLPEYRPKVFGMIKSLQYLDKLDADDNERPETDEEEDEDEDDVEDELADGIEGEGDEDGTSKFAGGQVNPSGAEEDDDVDEEDKDDDGEESDELDEEDDDGARYPAVGRVNHLDQVNEDSGSEEEEVDDEDDDEDDTENVEVHDVEESEEEGGDDEEDGEEDEEEEEDDEEEGTRQVSAALLSTEGEIDAQENEDDEDENGEIGDEEPDADGVEDAGENEDEEEEDYGTEYLVQPIGQVEDEEAASDFEAGEDDDDDDDDEDENSAPAPSLKRKRGKDEDDSSDEDDSTDEDDRSPKH